MAFKDLSGEVNYVKYTKDGEPVHSKGDVLAEGRFLKSYTDEKYGSLQYQFATDSGVTQLPGCGQLNYLMKLVKLGDLVRVTYAGRKELTDGKFKGKHAHQFKVAVDHDADPWNGDDTPF